MTTVKSSKSDLLKLGHKIRDKRLSLGLSQEDFSSRAGLHRTYISQLEQGDRNPTYGTLKKVSSALGLEVNSLLEE